MGVIWESILDAGSFASGRKENRPTATRQQGVISSIHEWVAYVMFLHDEHIKYMYIT